MAKKASLAGSDNVFEDLGHPRPAEALAKAELVRKIGVLTAEGVCADPWVAGRLSLDRLVRFLVLLGSDVEIVVRARPAVKGRARVMVT